jgi:hypothetical protein
VVRGNTCAGNNGAGIALVGDAQSKGRKWRAFHWILEANVLRANRWGVYMEHADWIDMAANVYQDNREAEVRNEGNVTNLSVHPDDPKITRPPRAVLAGPSAGKVGREVLLDASASTDPGSNRLSWRWDLGDGTIARGPRVAHAFAAPGFYRVGLTVTNGRYCDLAWRDFYAVEEGQELGTEGQAADWGWIDPQSQVKFSDDREVRIAGTSSVLAHVEPYGGMLVSLLYPAAKKAGLPLAGKTRLVFWVKAIDENVPAWQGPQPVVTLYESDAKFALLTPKADLMSGRPNNEDREGWSYLVVPLAGSDQWERKGELPATLNYLTIGFDSWGAPPLWIWLDGMSLR